MRTLSIAIAFCIAMQSLSGCVNNASTEQAKAEEAKQKLVREMQLRDAAIAGSNGRVVNTGPSVGDEHRRQQAERDKNLR